MGIRDQQTSLGRVPPCNFNQFYLAKKGHSMGPTAIYQLEQAAPAARLPTHLPSAFPQWSCCPRTKSAKCSHRFALRHALPAWRRSTGQLRGFPAMHPSSLKSCAFFDIAQAGDVESWPCHIATSSFVRAASRRRSTRFLVHGLTDFAMDSQRLGSSASKTSILALPDCYAQHSFRT